jgi:hypothetical protein
MVEAAIKNITTNKFKFLIHSIVYYFPIVTAFCASLNGNVVCKLIIQPCCKFMLLHLLQQIEKNFKVQTEGMSVRMYMCVRMCPEYLSICVTFAKHLHCQTWLLGSIHFIVK